MRQSSRRSKEALKGSLDARKPIIDYQDYEQQLASYQQSTKGASVVDLFDWSKPSQVIPLNRAKPQPAPSPKKEQTLQNNSMDTEELLRSEKDADERREDEYLDDSFEVQPSRPSFLARVQQDYGEEYRSQSCAQLQGELKAMRERIQQMNERLNRMLDRYELMARPIQKETVISNPHLLLTKEIQLNARILASQAEEIRQIQEKQRELERKDYLVELNQLIIEIGKEIHDTGKEKHSRWVDVERIDRLLKELQSVQGTEDEFRQVKELKVKIVYYFKKLKEQKVQEEELDLEMEKLVLRESQLSRQLEEYAQLAIQHSLQVTTNKKYIELKKKYQQLIVARESSRKKKDVTAKFQLASEDKLEREITAMRRELQKVEMQTKELDQKSMAIDGQTEDFIKKNNVLTRQIKSISYRFDDSLLHAESNREKFKPDFKRSGKAGSKEANRTAQQPIQKTSVRLINDKNVTIDDNSSNAELHQSKLKPMLRQWKGKSERPRYQESPSSKDYKTLEASNIFRPPLLLRPKK